MLLCYFFAGIDVIDVGFVFRTVHIAKKIRKVINIYNGWLAKCSEGIIVFKWISYVNFVIVFFVL
jgi:hypothetical protein